MNLIKLFLSWFGKVHPLDKALSRLNAVSELLYEILESLPEGAQKDRLRAVLIEVRAAAEILKML